MAITPRGIRNNNPGNIEYNPKVRWKGLAPMSEQTDGRFAKFQDPKYGIRALVKVLGTYHKKHKIDTIRGIVNRWAPANENNTDAYVSSLVEYTGFSEGQQIDLKDYNTLFPLVQGIIRHENGSQPYSIDQIHEGIVLAGIPTPGQKPLGQSRTIVASGVGGASVAGMAGLDAVSSGAQTLSGNLSLLVEWSDYIKYAFLGISILAFAIIIYARIDDWRKKNR